jgi:hypothetical protein
VPVVVIGAGKAAHAAHLRPVPPVGAGCRGRPGARQNTLAVREAARRLI